MGHPENDFGLAEWYAYAGSRERVLTALEEKLARHDPEALQMAVSPSFDDLHQDPRFLALLAHIAMRVPTSYPKPSLDASLK